MSQCNYCSYRQLIKEYGEDKLIQVPEDGGVTIYLKDSKPDKGQMNQTINGKFLSWYMSLPPYCMC